MAIYGIGAFFTEDVSGRFISANLVGVGWARDDAPELHQYMRSLKVGDIVYIKAFPPNVNQVIVKAIGIVVDDILLDESSTDNLVSCGRRVRWVSTEQFSIPKPTERNNVRQNTMYEEFHPEIQQHIINRIVAA
ncbi:MAG: hypothetical protein NTZ35_01265 [Ignavibacteriales bacterium]|nr:hypothetical protein [Ignavibacteriales bacterium]